MKTNWKFKVVVLLVFFLSMMVSVSFAVEAVVEKEKVPGVIITKEIIKTADNFIVMFDSSSSMKEPFQDTGLTTLDAAKKLLYIATYLIAHNFLIALLPRDHSLNLVSTAVTMLSKDGK